LLGCDAATVQADRMTAARALSQRLRCVLLLKGSGSILVSEDALPAINPSGNALLATGGTGDVLAGWVGGLWAQMAPQLGDLRAASAAAEAAAWLHGRAADAELESAPGSLAMRADDLAERMRKMAALHRAAASD
jgi:NAD(P)H-hydrate repair Nnr-like enzyme with NAD(P)H-hydrate dehydratase domain